MRWINAPEPGTMGPVMAEQAELLSSQMASTIMLDGGEEDGEEGMDDGAFMVMQHHFRGRRRGHFSYRNF